MKITLHPSDVLELCLFDKFDYYVLPKEIDRKNWLKENKEFEISEKDALVIGLLKCVETDNLVHKFNEYIDNFMNNRSSKIEDSFRVKKKALLQTIEDFSAKFPEFWEPNNNYKKAKDDLFVYLSEMKQKFENLPSEEFKEKAGTFEYVNCNSIKKSLRYHN